MKIGIGIDTGGTYTDALLYDFETNNILAKYKSLTTKENLSIGIKNAINALPSDILKKATLLSVSTTLATNACVEKKGGRAKLLLIGTNHATLEWINAKKNFGIDNDVVYCVETVIDKENDSQQPIMWDTILASSEAYFSDAQAISIVAKNAVFNGAIIEKEAKEKITNRYSVPTVLGSEVADNVNMMERGATALLNARLLSVVDEFIDAIHSALLEYNLNIKKMIVRSDGSLMNEELILKYPVTTILSGPAASVIGAKKLTNFDDSVIIDMGGTTTDISIVENSKPAMTSGINIGGYKTQIKGVLIDTFALGGDTRIIIQDGKVLLDIRRVIPLCALAKKYPYIKENLRDLINDDKRAGFTFHEFLVLVKYPKNTHNYAEYEIRIIELLKSGPVIISSGDFDVYNLKIDRLESEGIIMRSGLTPTDIMHLKGDFNRYDTEASLLASEYFRKIVPELKNDVSILISIVFNEVCKTLYMNIILSLLVYQNKKLFVGGVDSQIKALIEKAWEERGAFSYFALDFKTKPTLIGIGAPIHIFLPEVAKALHTECIIPEHADVANALGAIVADIEADVSAKISFVPDVINQYKVSSPEGECIVESEDAAIEYAKMVCEKLARLKALERGAHGELTCTTTVNRSVAYSKEGYDIPLGIEVTVFVNGRL